MRNFRRTAAGVVVALCLTTVQASTVTASSTTAQVSTTFTLPPGDLSTMPRLMPGGEWLPMHVVLSGDGTISAGVQAFFSISTVLSVEALALEYSDGTNWRPVPLRALTATQVGGALPGGPYAATTTPVTVPLRLQAAAGFNQQQLQLITNLYKADADTPELGTYLTQDVDYIRIGTGRSVGINGGNIGQVPLGCVSSVYGRQISATLGNDTNTTMSSVHGEMVFTGLSAGTLAGLMVDRRSSQGLWERLTLSAEPDGTVRVPAVGPAQDIAPGGSAGISLRAAIRPGVAPDNFEMEARFGNGEETLTSRLPYSTALSTVSLGNDFALTGGTMQPGEPHQLTGRSTVWCPDGQAPVAGLPLALHRIEADNTRTLVDSVATADDGAYVLTIPAGPAATYVFSTTGLSGYHTFSPFQWRLRLPDLEPPVVSITSHPPALTQETTAQFSFTATDTPENDVPKTFSCSIDGDLYRACTSPMSHHFWSSGLHTFAVKAKDPTGNESTPTSYTWRIDAVAPTVTIAGHPAALSRTTTAQFRVTATDAPEEGPVTFQCRLEDLGYEPCPPDFTYRNLAQGPHSFAVRAMDALGNVSVPAYYSWRIDSIVPVVKLHDLYLYNADTTLRASWWAADIGDTGGVTVDVRWQRAPYNAGLTAAVYPAAWQKTTRQEVTLSGLSRGYTYCFSIRARDTAGNVSAWAAPRCSVTPLDDRLLSRSAGWSQITGAGYYAATATKTTRLGAKLTRTGVRTKRIALVATRCPTCGTVGVYWNGRLIKTVNLAASRTTHRSRIDVVSFAAVSSGTLVLRSASSRKTVLIDGVALSRA